MQKQLKIFKSLKGIEFLSTTLEELAQVWNVPGKPLLELHLILEELCSNFIKYSDADQHATIDIQLILENSLLEITVKDRGKAFNPTQIPDPDIELPLDKRQPGGLGLYFVKHYSDSLHYSRKGDCNVVQITKDLHTT